MCRLLRAGIEEGLMARDEQSRGLVVLDPTNSAEFVEVSLAPRLDSLEGKVVGFLDNSKLNADRFLALLEQELASRYHLAEVVRARKPSGSRICPEEILSDLVSRCDAIITAVGD